VKDAEKPERRAWPNEGKRNLRRNLKKKGGARKKKLPQPLGGKKTPEPQNLGPGQKGTFPKGKKIQERSDPDMPTQTRKKIFDNNLEHPEKKKGPHEERTNTTMGGKGNQNEGVLAPKKKKFLYSGNEKKKKNRRVSAGGEKESYVGKTITIEKKKKSADIKKKKKNPQGGREWWLQSKEQRTVPKTLAKGKTALPLSVTPNLGERKRGNRSLFTKGKGCKRRAKASDRRIRQTKGKSSPSLSSCRKRTKTRWRARREGGKKSSSLQRGRGKRRVKKSFAGQVSVTRSLKGNRTKRGAPQDEKKRRREETSRRADAGGKRRQISKEGGAEKRG